jgi:hypothetical protein
VSDSDTTPRSRSFRPHTIGLSRAVRSPFLIVCKGVRYNRDVRRVLAISLLLLFSLPLISPLFALAANPGDKLPACCRRNGVHHCAIRMLRGEQSQGEQFTARQEKCPAYPRAVSPVQRNDLSPQSSAQLFAGIVVHPAGKAQAEARARIAFYRSRQERGPPALQA